MIVVALWLRVFDLFYAQGKTTWTSCHTSRQLRETVDGQPAVTVLAVFDPDLEWTYLDPSLEDPEPQTCYGRGELRKGLQRQADRGLKPTIEEVLVNGDKVAVVIHIPGLDNLRARQDDDRNYDVLTFRNCRIVAMRACRGRDEALGFADMPH
jgi:ketosteroid isomerase-like protein